MAASVLYCAWCVSLSVLVQLLMKAVNFNNEACSDTRLIQRRVLYLFLQWVRTAFLTTVTELSINRSFAVYNVTVTWNGFQTVLNGGAPSRTTSRHSYAKRWTTSCHKRTDRQTDKALQSTLSCWRRYFTTRTYCTQPLNSARTKPCFQPIIREAVQAWQINSIHYKLALHASLFTGTCKHSRIQFTHNSIW